MCYVYTFVIHLSVRAYGLCYISRRLKIILVLSCHLTISNQLVCDVSVKKRLRAMTITTDAASRKSPKIVGYPHSTYHRPKVLTSA